MTDEELAVKVLFENWFKSEYEWEMKRGVHLRKHVTDKGEFYIHDLPNTHYKSFVAGLKIAGLIK